MTDYPFGKQEKEYSIYEEPKPVYCQKCNCTGFILMQVKKEGYERVVAGRCSCGNGDRLSKRILAFDHLMNRLGFQEYEIMDQERPMQLEEIRYEELIEKTQLTFKGIVTKRCAKCRNDYRIEYKKETPIARIIEVHEYCKDRENNLCSLCFYKKGKNRGYWE